MRTLWGDPDLQGEWTAEGECGVPFERAPQFGTRQFLTDEEYAKRLEDVRIRDERDLAPVDVLSGKVDAPNAPIPHWRDTTRPRVDLAGDRSSEWTSPAANPDRPGRFPCSGAAACSAASRATATRITGSASAASCTAEAFPMRCFQPSTTPTSASSRRRAWSRSSTS